MKNYIYVSAIFLLTFFATGCNPEDQGNNGPKGTSTGFIEFKIDGSKYRIDDYNTNDGNGTVTFANTPSLPLYQVIIVFYTASPSGADNISLHQISQSPIEAKNYEYGDFNALERPTFIQILPSLYGYSVTTESRGNVIFTRFDTYSGGKVEGTFQLNNLNYHDKDINTISSNHNLTEGKFSVVVD